MSLYTQIKENFKLPNAYSDWATYRHTLTNHLINEVDSVSLPLDCLMHMNSVSTLPTLLIVGAGECNDIDLSQISSCFKKITLLDTDMQSMKKQPYGQLENISYIVQSLTGITEYDFEKYCTNLQYYVRETNETLTIKNFTQYAISQVQSIINQTQNDIQQTLPRHDYVWCFGVHSQLYSMFAYIYETFIMNLSKQYKWTDTNDNTFYEYIKTLNEQFIPQINEALIASAAKQLYIGCEWNEQSPVEGAHQCINHIRNNKSLISEQIIQWPFNPQQNIYYNMLIQTIKL